MRPRRFKVLVVFCAALSATLILFWLPSTRVYDAWDWNAGGSRHGIGSANGRLFYFRLTAPTLSGIRATGYNAVRPPTISVNEAPPNWSFAGFTSTYWWAGGVSFLVVRVPDWAPLALLVGAPPLLWLLRRRRPRPGVCRNCGYDLRATPNQCPECGVAPSEAWERRTSM